jgi:hypothetical protein
MLLIIRQIRYAIKVFFFELGRVDGMMIYSIAESGAGIPENELEFE